MTKNVTARRLLTAALVLGMNAMAGKMLWAQGAGAKGAATAPPASRSAVSRPSTTPPVFTATPQDLADAVKASVRDASGEKGFRMYDTKARKEVFLTLKKIDEDGLRPIGRGAHVVSGEFTAEDGTPYTLDFIVRGMAPENLVVAIGSTMIQASGGEPRYTWRENTVLRIYQQRPLVPMPARSAATETEVTESADEDESASSDVAAEDRAAP